MQAIFESIQEGILMKVCRLARVTHRLDPENTHSKNPIGVVRGSEVINNSLLDDTTDAKCFLHFNSVWFCMNGVSNLQNFV